MMLQAEQMHKMTIISLIAEVFILLVAQLVKSDFFFSLSAWDKLPVKMGQQPKTNTDVEDFTLVLDKVRTST